MEEETKKRYTYCSTLTADGYPQTEVVEVEGELPDGVPSFESRSECVEYLVRGRKR